MTDTDIRPLVTDTDYARLRGLMASPLALDREEVVDLLIKKLTCARIVPAARVPPSVVTMNSRATCLDEASGTARELCLVYPWNASEDGGVSVLSRIGIELLGAIPGHVIHTLGSALMIAYVSYQPEAEHRFYL